MLWKLISVQSLNDFSCGSKLEIQNFTKWTEIKEYAKESYELVIGIVVLIYLVILEGEK